MRRAIEAADTVILAIFNRFGDSVIAAAACAELMAHWAKRGKAFVVVTSPQMLPYLQLICREARIIPLRKGNPIAWLRVWLAAKRGGRTLGLNPYSFGKESRRVANLADQSLIYRNPPESFFVNYYDRVRDYLGLPRQGDFVNFAALPEAPRRILFCPESSEARRTLDAARQAAFVSELRQRWPAAEITVARSPMSGGSDDPGIRHLVLAKSAASSLDFLATVKASDLVVSVDSGPLHIATALDVFALGLFSSAHPATVINASARAAVLRQPILADVYCENIACRQPRCMDGLSFAADQCGAGGDAGSRRVVRDVCPAGYSPDEIGSQ